MGQGALTNKYIEQRNFTNTRVDEYLHYGKEEARNQAEFYCKFVRYFRKINQLNKLARERKQSLSQLTLVWLINNPKISTVVMGAGSPNHLVENLKCLESPNFTEQALDLNDQICRNE